MRSYYILSNDKMVSDQEWGPELLSPHLRVIAEGKHEKMHVVGKYTVTDKRKVVYE